MSYFHPFLYPYLNHSWNCMKIRPQAKFTYIFWDFEFFFICQFLGNKGCGTKYPYYLVAYLKATIIDNSNCRISAESCQGVVKAITVLCCTIPSVFARRCLAAVEVKNMTMKTMNIFLNILLTSDSDREYSHVFIRDLHLLSFVLQTKVLKTNVLKWK